MITHFKGHEVEFYSRDIVGLDVMLEASARDSMNKFQAVGCVSYC